MEATLVLVSLAALDACDRAGALAAAVSVVGAAGSSILVSVALVSLLIIEFDSVLAGAKLGFAPEAGMDGTPGTAFGTDLVAFASILTRSTTEDLASC